MWKKLENLASSRADSTALEGTNPNLTPENHAELLDDEWLIGTVKVAEQQIENDGQREVPAPATEINQPQRRPEPPATLVAYTEAVNKFTKSASAFVEHLPLLAEARQAYEEAARASTELRKILDSGDENLRALMSHLEQMVNVQLLNSSGAKSISEKRSSEVSRLVPVRVEEEARGA